MPHDDRPLMQPPPIHTFAQVYVWLEGLPGAQVHLVLPSGVEFVAAARIAGDGRAFIECSGGNRIYDCCWENRNNHMGHEGQRIGHYSAALDDNCQ